MKIAPLLRLFLAINKSASMMTTLTALRRSAKLVNPPRGWLDKVKEMSKVKKPIDFEFNA